MERAHITVSLSTISDNTGVAHQSRKSTRLSLIVCRWIVDIARILCRVDIRRRLALNLKRYRAAQGLSQEKFAFEAGVHRTYVSDIERGARNPSITILDKLAAPLGIGAASLIEEVPGSGG